MVDVTTTGTLILDESAGNTENDTNLTNANPALAISAGFLSYLTTNSLLTGIIEEAKDLTITVDPQGSTINSLAFTNAAGQPFSQTVGTQVIDTISGLPVQTIGGENVFLFGTADPDVVIARDTSGDLVAVFYLNDPTNLSASVEMVAYQALDHHDATRDGGESAATQDLLDWGSQLSVSATGSLTFSFDNLDSGNFLYAAFGTTSAGIVLTGEDLNVNDTLKQNGTPGANFGEEVSGGSDPTDTMNTSQGGAGATIGVNAQDFREGGGTAVVTFITGFVPLTGITDGSTFGHDVRDILYDQYINTSSASIFLSQQTGSDASGMTVTLWEAGGNNTSAQDTTDNAPADLVAEEGYGPIPNPPLDNSGYIGDDDTDVQLKNDWPVAVASVTITRAGTDYTWTAAGAAPATPPTFQGVVMDVDFNGNAFTVVGLSGLDTIKFTAANIADDPTNPASLLDGTFNRFKIEPVAGNFDIGAISLTEGVGDRVLVGDSIFTDDDRPVQNTTVVTKAVGEDTLSTTDSDPLDTIPADLSNGIPDSGDTKTDEVSYTYADIASIVNVGLDAPADTSLRSSFVAGTAVTIANAGNTQLKSKGDNVFWAVEAGTGVVQGVTGTGRVVFELSDNGTTGYLFDLQDQVDHADASGDNGTLSINLTPAFVITDDDLDPAALSGQAILVSVENDVPEPTTATPISREVQEDALTGGNTPDAGDSETKVLTATYTAADLATLVTSGADEDVTFSLNTATSGGGAIIGTNVVTTGGANVTSKEVNVTWAAGTIAGTLRGITTVGATVTTVFTLAPSATPGEWVFTLADQVDHSGAEDDLELLPIDLTKAFLGVDFDKDPVTLANDSVVLNVENDLPLFGGQISGSTIDQGDKSPVSKSLNGDVGADEDPHYVIDKYEDLAGYIEEINATNTKVSYFVDTDPGAGETKGALAFTLEVFDTNTLANPDDNTGMYTFTNFLDAPQERLEFDFTFFPSGSSMFGILLDNDEQSDLTPDSGLLVIGRTVVLNSAGSMVTGTDTINTSAGGGPVTIGVNNQMFDPGEGAVFVYLANPERNSSATQSKTDGLTQTTADDADALGFGGTIESMSGSVEVVQRQGSETLAMKITAYDLADDDQIVAAFDPLGGKTKKIASDDVSQEARDWVNNSDGNPSTPDDVLSSGTETKINTIKVYDTLSGDLLTTFTIDTTTGAVTDDNLADGITVVADHVGPVSAYDFVTVHGFGADSTIQWTSDAVHDAVLIEGFGGAWDVGGFNIEQGVDSPDVEIDFSVAITDRDNDSFSGSAITLDDFTIRLDGTGANNQEPDVDPPAPSPSYDAQTTLMMFVDNNFQDVLF